jgi:hypothetical protein
MSRSRLRGLGLVTAALLAASLTLSTPASAEGTAGTIVYDYLVTSSGRFVVRNAGTGDPMAVGDLDSLLGSLHLLVIGAQTVKIECFCGNGAEWHGGTDFATAAPVSIPASGTKQVIFTRP